MLERLPLEEEGIHVGERRGMGGFNCLRKQGDTSRKREMSALVVQEKKENLWRDERRLWLLGEKKKNQEGERDRGTAMGGRNGGWGSLYNLRFSHLVAQVPRFQNTNFHFVISLTISQIRGRLQIFILLLTRFPRSQGCLLLGQ